MRSGRRRENGQGIIGISAVLMLVLGIIGFFGYEVNRVQLVRSQLKAIADSASLTGTAMLASMDNTESANLAQNQRNAILYAEAMVRRNGVMGSSLSAAESKTSLAAIANPGPNQTNVFIEPADPLNDFASVPIGDQRGRALRVHIAHGYVPFAGVLGLGHFDLRGTSTSGLPRLDVILCFDLSGSMDDSTRVTFVRRVYNPSVLNRQGGMGAVDYVRLPRGSAPTAMLSDYLGLRVSTYPDGTRVNTQFPQGLYYAMDNRMFSRPLVMNPRLRSLGPNDFGTRPGNDPNVTPGPPIADSEIQPNHFTDLVVNVADPGPRPYNQPLANSPNDFVGFNWRDPDTGKTFRFTNLPTLVEAARGNLEDATVMAASGANTYNGPLGAVDGPQPGIRDAYRRLARLYSQPIATAIDAAQRSFFDQLNSSADCHFGLVCFEGSVGPGAGGSDMSVTTNLVALQAPGTPPSYSQNVSGMSSSTGTFPVPGVEISKTESRYDAVRAALDNAVPLELLSWGTRWSAPGRCSSERKARDWPAGELWCCSPTGSRRWGPTRLPKRRTKPLCSGIWEFRSTPSGWLRTQRLSALRTVSLPIAAVPESHFSQAIRPATSPPAPQRTSDEPSKTLLVVWSYYVSELTQ